MEKKIYIMPEKSGKSLLADYEFSKEPKNTMFIGYDNKRLQHIKSFKMNINNFFTQFSNLKGLSFENAIIDDYLIFNLKGLKNLYENLYLIGIKKIIIFSSINYVDKDMFNFIKLCKLKNIYWKSKDGIELYSDDIKNKFQINTYKQNEKMIDELDKLYFNFLTDSDTEIIFKPSNYYQYFYKL